MSEIERTVKILDCIATALLDDVERGDQKAAQAYAAMRMAIQALREKLERENPKPLTLEEVIEMPGEPVWCCYEKENKEIVTDCRLVSRGAFGCIGIDEKYLLFREYGVKWLAYRYEPKGIEHISEATNMVKGE